MSKKEKKETTGSSVTIVKPEIKIEVEQRISQQDIIELVAYKQIKKLEGLKSEANERLKKVKSELKDLDENFVNDVTKEVNILAAHLLSVLKKEPKIEIKKDIISFSDKDKGYPLIFELDLDKLSTKKSDKHLELNSKQEELYKSINELDSDISKIRNDKNSIKNAITEQLLLESDEGKDLLSLVEKAYEQSFPKLLK